ncbi:MAG: hypothetical protein SPK04_03690 [Succinivibrionaceae bacterium]|nr:hypothetical protein [Succinivibrionaceae bacterium]
MKLKLISKITKNCLALGLATLAGFYSIDTFAQSSRQLDDEDRNEIRKSIVSKQPLTISTVDVPTLLMIVLARDHRLYSEAYNDYSDLDYDDQNPLNINFDPGFTYYGLFDSNLCYQIETSPDLKDHNNGSTSDFEKLGTQGIWIPKKIASEKEVHLEMWGSDVTKKVKVCPGENLWSGNLLNYATTSRLDIIRKVLYGGKRATNYDTNRWRNAGDIKTVTYNYDGGKSAVLLEHSSQLRENHSWVKVFNPKMYGENTPLTYDDFIGVTQNDTSKTLFMGLGGYVKNNGAADDQYLDMPGYFRFGFVNNAGLPGVEDPKHEATHFIWDWADNETNMDEESSETNLSVHHKIFENSEVKTYNVIVAACVEPYIDQEYCYNYGTSEKPLWRPIGILQQYESNVADSPIKFGLLTGSWNHNLDQGQVRASFGDFTKSEMGEDGLFNYKGVLCEQGGSTICGIVSTLDTFRLAQAYKIYDGGFKQYDDCKRNQAKDILKGIKSGQCTDWGTPVARLLDQSASYFKGEATTYRDEDKLGLGNVKLESPYNHEHYCSRPVSLVIADDNTTHDDKFNYNFDKYQSDLDGIDIEAGDYLVGSSVSDKGKDNTYYKFPSVKHVNKLSDISGIAPSSAFEFGSYNVAGVAKHFAENADIKASETVGGKTKTMNHKMETYVVAMKSNMPEIKIPISTSSSSDSKFSENEETKYVTIVPFGVTFNYGVGNDGGISQETSFNQIVDFFVEKISNDHGVVRVVFEDYEYGSDYDMDWIVEYEYKVTKSSSGASYVRVQIRDVSGDGYENQKAGYVITGVDHNGVYIDLEKPSAGYLNGDFKLPRKAVNDLDNLISDIHLIENHGFGIGTNVSKESIRDAMDVSQWDDNQETVKKYHGLGYGQLDGKKVNFCAVKHDWDEHQSMLMGVYSELDNPSRIDAYYKRISNLKSLEHPEVNIYYANRKDLVDKIRLSDAGIYDGREEPGNQRWHLLGNYYKCTAYDGLNVSSRMFKINAAKASDVYLKSPLWYAAKYGLSPTNANRFTSEDPSNYYLVTNPTMLKDGITKMLEQLKQAVHSGSGFSPETTATSEGTGVVATQFEKTTWWGNVVRGTVGKDGGYDEEESSSGKEGRKSKIKHTDWQAYQTYEDVAENNLSARLVLTFDYDYENGSVQGRFVRLYSAHNDASDGENSALDNLGENVFNKILPSSSKFTSGNHSDDANLYMNRFIRWYLGDKTQEHNGSKIAHPDYDLKFNDNQPLRVRSIKLRGENEKHFVLGDIIDSNAKIFSTKNGNKYVVVGANDGMIHFMKYADGTPVLSYVPTPMLGEIHKLAKQDYARAHHELLINSTPEIYKDDAGNVFIYGTYGLGVKGGYVLDATYLHLINSPYDAQIHHFLKYELTEKVVKNGKVYGSDYVGKMNEAPVLITKTIKSNSNSKKPYLVYSSGFDAKKNGLVIVDLYNNGSECKTGQAEPMRPCIVNEIDLGKDYKTSQDITDPWELGRKNAIAPATVIKLRSYSDEYDAIYAGDLFGNLWKIPTTQSDKGTQKMIDINRWGKTIKPEIIFRASDSDDVAQPITGKIGAAFAEGGIKLVFGTGSLAFNIDNKEVSERYNLKQSVYVIKDNPNEAKGKTYMRCDKGVSRDGCLVPLEREGERREKLRNYKAKGNMQSGLYVDLEGRIDGDIKAGERVYTNPLVINNIAAITTNLPNTKDPCNGVGKSSVFYLDLINGTFKEMAQFDSLSKSPIASVHHGKVVIHVPHDSVSESNISGGTPETSDFDLDEKGVKRPKEIHLY